MIRQCRNTVSFMAFHIIFALFSSNGVSLLFVLLLMVYIWSICVMLLSGGRTKYSQKTLHSATSPSITNLTQTVQGLNPGMPVERLVTNRLSHDEAFRGVIQGRYRNGISRFLSIYMQMNESTCTQPKGLSYLSSNIRFTSK